jgi:hypothetical protein
MSARKNSSLKVLRLLTVASNSSPLAARAPALDTSRICFVSSTRASGWSRSIRDELQQLTAIPGTRGRDRHEHKPVSRGEDLLSWTGLCPLLDESAGKRLSMRLRKGWPEAYWCWCGAPGGLTLRGDLCASPVSSPQARRGLTRHVGAFACVLPAEQKCRYLAENRAFLHA